MHAPYTVITYSNIFDKVRPKLRTYVHVRVLYAYIGSKYEYFRTMTYMDNCHVPCFLLYFLLSVIYLLLVNFKQGNRVFCNKVCKGKSGDISRLVKKGEGFTSVTMFCRSSSAVPDQQ